MWKRLFFLVQAMNAFVIRAQTRLKQEGIKDGMGY